MASRSRRSERHTTVRPPAPKKPPRRSSKTDPTVKPLVFWSAEEVAQIVQAWRDTVANPPARPRKTAGGFNARLYARFVEICGGTTMRVLQSVVAKKQLLNNSYQFILEYNQKKDELLAAKTAEKGGKAAGTAGSSSSIKKSPAKGKSARGRGGGDTGDDDEESKVNHWFELTKTQQKAAAMKMFLTDQRQYALLSMDQRTFDSMVEISKLEGKLSIRQPWSDDEVQLMFRAWREAINKPPKASGNRNPLFSMNSRMYQHMVNFSNGTLKRTKQSVVLKKDSMKLSCEFILQYNEKQRELSADQQMGSSKKKQPPAATWFSLIQKEQERVVAQKFPKSSFMYFSESQFHEIDALIKDSERQGNEFGGRQTVVWTHDEHVLLVRAWRDTVYRPLSQLEPNVTFGSCVYERFMAMSKGEYSRSERSTLLKLTSMKKMYEFIAEYNQNTAKDPSHDWFSLERPERKRTHLESARVNGVSEDRTRSFTDFDRPMFDAMTKILDKDRPLDAITFVVQQEGQGDGDDDDEDGDDEDDDDDEEESEVSDESDSDFAVPSSSRRARIRVKKKPEPEEEQEEENAASGDDGDDEGESRKVGKQADTTDDEGKIDGNAPNSFIQVAKDQEQPTTPAQESGTTVHPDSNREGEPMHDARDLGGEEEQENSSVSSSKALQVNVNRSASSTSSRAEKKRQRPTPEPRTPSSFSLHELADLAMRVNNAADSGAESDASSRGTEAGVAQDPQQQRSSGEVQKKRKLSLDVSAIVEVLEKQSEKMIIIMREIRDEMRRDREERERFREEMRLDREERRKQADERSDGQSGSESEEKPPSKKKKNSRRLSVQREGFVVRL